MFSTRSMGSPAPWFGEYLFFWIVSGKGNAMSDFATAVLGSITIAGVARLIAAGRAPLSSK